MRWCASSAYPLPERAAGAAGRKLGQGPLEAVRREQLEGDRHLRQEPRLPGPLLRHPAYCTERIHIWACGSPAVRNSTWIQTGS